MPSSPTRGSAARDRLLQAASAVFYAEGINTVGVGRLVEEGQVTLATFYRHFPSKQDLVVAYLEAVHAHIEATVAELTARLKGAELLRAIGADIGADLCRPGFHGCAFIRAAAETSDPESPVARAVLDHRTWYQDVIRDGFVQAGHARPDDAARRYVMLRDGAMIAGMLGDVTTAQQTFAAGLDDLLGN